MAKVQILQGVAGEHFTWQPGQVIEMPDDEAAKWADGVRGTDAAEGAVVHQTYDPSAIPVGEVLVEEAGVTPEPHGYFPPSDESDDDESDDEGTGGEPVTPEANVPALETPETPKRGRQGRQA